MMDAVMVNLCMIGFANTVCHISIDDNKDPINEALFKAMVKQATKELFHNLNEHIDWKELTVLDAYRLGFRPWMDDKSIDHEIELIRNDNGWSDEEKQEKILNLERVRDLYLIPIYILPIIPAGVEFTSIDGDTLMWDGDNVEDRDTRFGCLAWGIKLKEDKNNVGQ